MSRPSVAYLIASHTLPEQVLRLAGALRAGSPGAPIVLHHDSRRTRVDAPALRALDVELIEPPSAAEWAEASQLAMVLRCLRFALERLDFDWLVLLSGQDYPIRPLAAVEQDLGAAGCDGFVEAQPCPRPRLGARVDEFAGRYHFRWFHPRWSGAAALARRAARGGRLLRARALPSGQWVGVRALRSPFGAQLECRRGSDWMTLSRRAVSAVESFRGRCPEVEAYYRRTLHPTESFVQTALANDGSIRLSGDTRRYMAWDERRSGPRILRGGDLAAMLASGCDFARKFDASVDAGVLDELDRRLRPAGGG